MPTEFVAIQHTGIKENTDHYVNGSALTFQSVISMVSDSVLKRLFIAIVILLQNISVNRIVLM